MVNLIMDTVKTKAICYVAFSTVVFYLVILNPMDYGENKKKEFIIQEMQALEDTNAQRGAVSSDHPAIPQILDLGREVFRDNMSDRTQKNIYIIFITTIFIAAFIPKVRYWEISLFFWPALFPAIFLIPGYYYLPVIAIWVLTLFIRKRVQLKG